MLVLRLLNDAPLWLVIPALLFLLELYSIGLMLFCRWKWGADRLKVNNEVAGFKFSVIGVLYAVLLAYIVIVVWQDYNGTATAVRNEAKAVGDLTALSYALPDAEGNEIRTLVADYAHEVRQNEWQTMAQGLPSATTAHALAHLTHAIFALQATQIRDPLLQQALQLLATIEDSRNERLDSANGSVPPIVWLVLVAGGLITLGYPALFGTSSIAAQILMTAALAALVALALLPAILLDFPFTGPVTLSSDAFEEALQQMVPHAEEHPVKGTENPSP
jgi:hypothetical protein